MISRRPLYLVSVVVEVASCVCMCVCGGGDTMSEYADDAFMDECRGIG